MKTKDILDFFSILISLIIMPIQIKGMISNELSIIPWWVLFCGTIIGLTIVFISRYNTPAGKSFREMMEEMKDENNN